MQSIAVSGTMSPPPATGRVTAMSPRHSTDREGTASTNPDMTIDRAFAQFEGWHLGIATKCLDIPHGAFGALCIAFSYFETVWQLTRGESSKGRSSEAFREGLLLVFPALDACSESDLKSLSEALYGGFRNSFFHNMIVGHSVAIAVYPWLLLMLRDGTPVLALSNDGAMFGTSELPDEYGVDARRYAGTQGDFICLNPHTFIPALVSHLGQFRTEIETGTDDGKDRFLRGYWGLLGARPEGQPN
ncbi:MAG: hypothetical protein IT341_07140 [Chloroflexi bacterium]|nr:hypothetical protein [Chloroflexota bacterium]